MPDQRDIFVSYSRANTDFARDLYAKLSALEALHEEQARLQEYGFEIFDPQGETARNKAAGASLAVSLKRLGKWQDRFIELAIFPEDTDMPLAAIAKLWQASAGLREMDAKDALRAIHRLSLFARYELSELRRFARLHDVIRKYLRGKLGERLSTLHTKFLSAYGVETWADLPADEPYLWDHLAYHLLEAGKRDNLRAAVLDYRYLSAKLDARDTNALLSDCDAYLSGGANGLRLLWSGNAIAVHAADRTILARFYGDANIRTAAWSSDGKYIAAGDITGRVLFLRWVA